MTADEREPDEREANLEFWSGRERPVDDGEDAAHPLRSFAGPTRGWRPVHLPRLRFRRLSFTRPAFTRPNFTRSAWRLPGRGRVRPIAAAVLLAGLAAAWLVVGHRSPGSADAQPTRATSSPASVRHRPEPTTTALARTVIPLTADCGGLSVARPEVRCVIDGVDLDVRLSAPGITAAAYTRATGVKARPAAGPPVCARGVPDERSWSEASSPAVAVGRYRCRVENGRAAMWWTRGDRLSHAIGPDRDLAALFAWWRAHPSE